MVMRFVATSFEAFVHGAIRLVFSQVFPAHLLCNKIAISHFFLPFLTSKWPSVTSSLSDAMSSSPPLIANSWMRTKSQSK